jgi:hypothetical protein
MRCYEYSLASRAVTSDYRECSRIVRFSPRGAKMLARQLAPLV